MAVAEGAKGKGAEVSVITAAEFSPEQVSEAYVHVTAAGLRMKDSVMGTVTTVQENAADILASAKELNEDRAAKEAEEAAAANLESEEA